MKLLPTTIEQCNECPYLIVSDIMFGHFYGLRCRLTNKFIPDEGILAGCPLDDDTSDIRQKMIR